MAAYYVDSNAAGAGTGANWANAYTTLDGALSGKAAGDVFYVSHDHAQTQASALSITTPGTVLAPCFVYCVNKAGTVPPVSADLRATATITTTGANAITIGGQWVYFYGLTFNVGSGAVSSVLSLTSAGGFIFEACKIAKKGTAVSTTAISMGQNNGFVRFINTTVEFGHVGDCISPGARFEWYDTPSAIQGATIPTTGLIGGQLSQSHAEIRGVDLSALGSGSTIIRAITGIQGYYNFTECKFGASVTPAATPATLTGRVSFIRCDSGDTNYRSEKYDYTGTLTTETTIVRTGGASDGTTPIAWKVITTANSERIYPFECFPIVIWNETTGSAITVTVECRGAAVPNTDEVWMDVVYLGTSGSSLTTKTTSGVALLSSGAACTSSSETWGGSTASFKLTATFTPQEKGPITAFVKVAKVSSTFYIDPLITIS
jgi:hypothetical protein